MNLNKKTKKKSNRKERKNNFSLKLKQKYSGTLNIILEEGEEVS